MLTEENWQELETILTRSRWARLREELEILEPSSTLCLDLNNALHIFCSKVEEAAALSVLQSQIQHQAWLIIGCQSLYLWLAGVQVAHCDLESEASAILEARDMATATVEKVTNPADLLEETANRAIATVQEITRQQLQERIQGYVHSDEYAQFVLKESTRLANELLSTIRQTPQNGKVEEATTIDVTPQPTATTSELTPEAEEPQASQPDTTFKIQVNYQRTFYNALEVYAKNQKQRLSLIQDVRKATSRGTKFIDWVVNHYPAEKQQRARAGLLKAEVLDKVEQRVKKAA